MKISDFSTASLTALEAALREKLTGVQRDVNSREFLETATELAEVQQVLRTRNVESNQQNTPSELTNAAPPDFVVFVPKTRKKESAEGAGEPRRSRAEWLILVREALNLDLPVNTPKAIDTQQFAKTYRIPYVRFKDSLPVLVANGEITRTTNGVRGIQVITRLSKPLPRHAVTSINVRGDMVKRATEAIISMLSSTERREIDLVAIRAKAMPHASFSTFRNSLSKLVRQGIVVREDQASTGKTFYTLKPTK